LSLAGTAAYDGRADLPPLVAAAVALARRTSFAHSCRPEQGHLLRLLASGVGAGAIGETGTGCGVGLAWLATGAAPGATLASVERDADRAASARTVFAGRPNVTIVDGDWRDLPGAPFDLLVLDGGGKGKSPGDTAVDPADGWLRTGGTIVLDDFTPMGEPGAPAVDDARRHWLEEAGLRAAEVRLSPVLATIVGVRAR